MQSLISTGNVQFAFKRLTSAWILINDALKFQQPKYSAENLF